jgi:glycogen synthase
VKNIDEKNGRKLPMRLLLYSHCYYPSVGGVEYHTRHLARFLQRVGHPTTVVTPVPESLTWQPEPDDTPIVRNPGWKTWRDLAATHDLMLSNGFSASAIAHSLMHRIPITFIQYNVTLFTAGGSKSKEVLAYLLRKFYLRFGRGHICNSTWVREGLQPRRSIVLPVPIDLSRYQATTGEAGEPSDVIYIGRLIDGKGIQTILRAVEVLKRKNRFVRLAIVGTGPIRSHLEDLTRELTISDQVKFWGLVSNQELVKTLIASKILLLCSDTYPEGFGIVVAEGMACGKPVIVSDQQPLIETAGEGGLSVPRADPQALAQAIELLLENPTLYQKYSEAAKRRAQDFSIERVGSKSLTFLQSCLR